MNTCFKTYKKRVKREPIAFKDLDDKKKKRMVKSIVSEIVDKLK